jgi:hypothetical protein
MHEALCRSSGTTLDSVHAEDGPPITQRTSGLKGSPEVRMAGTSRHPQEILFLYALRKGRTQTALAGALRTKLS